MIACWLGQTVLAVQAACRLLAWLGRQASAAEIVCKVHGGRMHEVQFTCVTGGAGCEHNLAQTSAAADWLLQPDLLLVILHMTQYDPLLSGGQWVMGVCLSATSEGLMDENQLCEVNVESQCMCVFSHRYLSVRHFRGLHA